MQQRELSVGVRKRAVRLQITFLSSRAEKTAVGLVRCAGYSAKEAVLTQRTRGGTALIRPLSVFSGRGFCLSTKCKVEKTEERK